MKKLALLALATLGLMACRSDNGNEPTVIDNLVGDFPVGAWRHTKNVHISGADNSTILENAAQDMVCGTNSRFFKIYNTGGRIERFNTNTSCYEVVSGSITGSYTYNANTRVITATWPSSTSYYRIRKIEGNKIYVYIDQALVDVNGDGVLDRPVLVWEKH